jgi:putative membrane protein
MIDLLVMVGVNAAALLVAANVVPEFSLVFKTDKLEDWIQILLIALLFAIVNSYIKPIVKMLAMPIGFMTMGLVAFVINAGMVLGIAWLVNQAKDTLTVGFTVGHFPAQWGYETIGCAVVASIVISVVGTVLNLLLAPRKIAGF